MEPFGSLTPRGQVRRLHRLGLSALSGFGLGPARLTPLRHEQNTTFKVEADGGPYVLRISRPGVHEPVTIGSEMAWLTALRRDTDLGVPEPIHALDGSLVLDVSDPGVPEPRSCVLLRWLEGRFVDERLAPRHLGQVGLLEARLQLHTVGWIPPDGFVRPRVDTLTDAERRASVGSAADASRPGVHPTREDADRALGLVAELMSDADATVLADALDVVWAAIHELGTDPGASGLIHGDLHYENFLFHRGAARAIDFDDCGWGFYLYDLVVSLWELEGRPHYDAMRAALLDAYARLRPLPDGYETQLLALAILRRTQMLIWMLESRGHATFRPHWERWAREERDGIAAALEAYRRRS